METYELPMPFEQNLLSKCRAYLIFDSNIIRDSFIYE